MVVWEQERGERELALKSVEYEKKTSEIEQMRKEATCESLHVNLKREVSIKGSKIFELEGIVISVDNDVIQTFHNKVSN